MYAPHVPAGVFGEYGILLCGNPASGGVAIWLGLGGLSGLRVAWKAAEGEGGRDGRAVARQGASQKEAVVRLEKHIRFGGSL